MNILEGVNYDCRICAAHRRRDSGRGFLHVAQRSLASGAKAFKGANSRVRVRTATLWLRVDERRPALCNEGAKLADEVGERVGEARRRPDLRRRARPRL